MHARICQNICQILGTCFKAYRPTKRRINDLWPMGESYVGSKHVIVTVAWNVLWPCRRSGKNVKHAIQGHCGHQRTQISQQVPAQVEQQCRFRSSWRAPRQSAERTGPRLIASSTAIWSRSSRPGWAGTGQKVS